MSSLLPTTPPHAQAAFVRSRVSVPLRFADGYETVATVLTFTAVLDGKEHLVLGLGAWEDQVASREPVLVRLHSECLTGDVFGSSRCDCGPQLREAVERLTVEGGILVYLRQEGRGIGLYAKLDAYALQDTGLDTYEANWALGFESDEREYAVAAQLLRAVGVEHLTLLSNNPDKAEQLLAAGLNVSSTPTEVHLSADNAQYLLSKVRRTAHTLALPLELTS